MSTAKFEKLIDLIINEDQERAEQLFHEIVVEKSREIYESLMDEDMTTGLMDEISHEEEGMDGMMEDEDEFVDDEIENDDITVDGDEEESEEEFDDEEIGDDEIGDEEMELGSDEAVTKDDIMNLEDKLDQLMAEFEAEFGEEEAEEESDVMEAVELKKVAGLYDSKIGGDDGANAKSPVVANAGAKGPVGSVVKPVKFSGDAETVPTSPKQPSNYGSKGEKLTGDAYQNSPAGAKGVKDGKGEAAPKPKTETVKAKSPVAESRTAKKRI